MKAQRAFTEHQLKRFDERGFTLIELVVVIAIIGILTAIALPVYGNLVDGANGATGSALARQGVTTASSAIRDEDDSSGPGAAVLTIARQASPQYFVTLVPIENLAAVRASIEGNGAVVEPASLKENEVCVAAIYIKDNPSWAEKLTAGEPLGLVKVAGPGCTSAVLNELSPGLGD